MKFQISRSNYCTKCTMKEQMKEIEEELYSDYPVLNKYKVDIIERERKYEPCIEINSLEELIALKSELCYDLIIYEEGNIVGIEIYDDLRE